MAETAQALYTALTLAPADRRAKAALGRQMVERSDLTAWLTRQIHDLNAVLKKRAFALSRRRARSTSPDSECHVTPSSAQYTVRQTWPLSNDGANMHVTS